MWSKAAPAGLPSNDSAVRVPDPLTMNTIALPAFQPG
jgi:hypothetical protein